MNGDALERLLKQADASAGPPPLPGDMAQRIRLLHRRRQKARMVAASAAVAAAALLAVLAWQWGGSGQGGPERQRIAADKPAEATALMGLQARIAALETQADLTQAAVGGLLVRQRQDARLGELRQQLWLLEAVDPLAERFDQAARKLLCAADRLKYELNNPRAAGELYRLVVRQFPDTPAAQFARARLTEHQSTTGESS